MNSALDHSLSGRVIAVSESRELEVFAGTGFCGRGSGRELGHACEVLKERGAQAGFVLFDAGQQAAQAFAGHQN